MGKESPFFSKGTSLILGAKDFVGPQEMNNFTVISTNTVQRRGSVPCESSTITTITTTSRSNNKKHRNTKKVLYRRSSSGAEILTPIMADTMDSGACSSSKGGNGSDSAWYRFKKDVMKRKEADYLTKRRGSLPVEVLSLGLGMFFLFSFLLFNVLTDNFLFNRYIASLE
jgi:hypothetical protein